MLKKSVRVFGLIFLASYAAASVDVQIGSTQVIAPQQVWSTCPKGSIVEFENGDLQVVARIYLKRSADNGVNWTDANTYFSSYTYPYPSGGALSFYGAVSAAVQSGLYLTTMMVSEDNGQTGFVKPSQVILEGQWEGVVASSHSQIIEIGGGVLLTSMYGKMTGDLSTQAFALRSEDWGDSWYYVSTIAHDDENIPGGFNESDLLLMPDGSIHCFIRAEVPSARNLYLCTSYDGGYTWSDYRYIFDKAASPHALLMSSGVIAIATGRPGNWLVFSSDNGDTWGNAVHYYTGPNPPDCSNYTSLVETVGNELLVVYTRTDAVDNNLSEVAGTFFTVTPNVIFADADFNDDGEVDWLDLYRMADNWLGGN